MVMHHGHALCVAGGRTGGKSSCQLKEQSTELSVKGEQMADPYIDFHVNAGQLWEC